MNRIPTLAIVLVAIGLGSLVFSLTYTAYTAMPYPNWHSQGMMGQGWNGMSGMMGNGMMGGMMSQDTGMGSGMMNGMMATSSIDNATFNAINLPPPGVTVNEATNTVNVDATGVTIPIEAAPLWYPRSGEFWVLYGLVNPTIDVKLGVEVHFLFINMDNEVHVPAITTMAPPYPYMPMMSGMMNSNYTFQMGSMLSGVQASTNVANPVYSDTTLSMSFMNTGTFWYPCLYLDHAQMGMYGEIQVTN